MFNKPLILLISIGLLNANPLSVETFSKILEYSRNVFYKRTEVLVNFEYNNRIGVAWFEMGEAIDKTETYNFNYMRFDEDGKILTDMRKFKITPANLDAYGIDWERSIPTLHYITDKEGNSLLIYSYGEKGWRIGWLQVDSVGRIVANKTSILSKPTKPLDLVASPDNEGGFHLYWESIGGGGIHYYNPKLEEAIPLSKKFAYTETGFALSDSQFVLITPPNAFNSRIGPDSFEYRIISDKGRLIEEKTLEWKPFLTCYWENIDLPISYETFKIDNTIYFLFPNENKVNLITFTPEGEAIKPDKCAAGSLLKMEQIPADAAKFVKIYKGIIYYFGFDNTDNLYYWKSSEMQN